MRRHGVFVFYDREGIVEEYVVVLLESLKNVLDSLTIIVSGEIQPNEKKKIEKYGDYWHERENKGFDAGAYKDFFLSYSKEISLDQYDELVIFNDTFYGPFYPWELIFHKMEEKSCDFWGLSRLPGKETFFTGGRQVCNHIQSYFIAIRRNMFMSRDFKSYWEELEYPKSFDKAVADFEIYFSQYHGEHGYIFTSWADVQNEEAAEVTDTAIRNSSVLITKKNFPILKRKYCGVQYFLEMQEVFTYIKENTSFPFSVIEMDYNRRARRGVEKPYSPRELLEFCGKYSSLYLYGNGRVAGNVEGFLAHNNVKVQGKIVTSLSAPQKDVFEFSKFKLPKDAGVVIAVGMSNCQEIQNKVIEKYGREKIFLPDFG